MSSSTTSRFLVVEQKSVDVENVGRGVNNIKLS